MVTCDIARVLIMAVIAIPGVPLPVVLVLVLLAAFFAPPFDAARSASLPAVLSGERYVLGLALFTATNQPAQVVGYLLGSALSISEPRLASRPTRQLRLSALMLRFRLSWREPGCPRDAPDRCMRPATASRWFSAPALRAINLSPSAACCSWSSPRGWVPPGQRRLAARTRLDPGPGSWRRCRPAQDPAGRGHPPGRPTLLVPDALLAVAVPATWCWPRPTRSRRWSPCSPVAAGSLGALARRQQPVRAAPATEYRARASAWSRPGCT